jgi:ABC-type uncharacterized transport system auxiliary subunit
MTASTISTPIRAPRSLRRRVLATALLLLPLLVGCFHGRLPARELYRLRLPENADTSPIQDHDGGTLPTGTLAIVPYVAPGMYGDRSIVFRIDESEYGAYPNREWALPVSAMLGMLTEDVLRRRPITAEQAVFDPPSPHNYTYIWRGLVRELEEVDRGRDVFAAVRLDARLVRASDDSVIWTGTARVERRVPSPSMTAIVDTLSHLAAEAVSQLLETARAALPIPAASAVRARRPDAVDRS